MTAPVQQVAPNEMTFTTAHAKGDHVFKIEFFGSV